MFKRTKRGWYLHHRPANHTGNRDMANELSIYKLTLETSEARNSGLC